MMTKDGAITPDGYAVNTIQTSYQPHSAKITDPANHWKDCFLCRPAKIPRHMRSQAQFQEEKIREVWKNLSKSIQQEIKDLDGESQAFPAAQIHPDESDDEDSYIIGGLMATLAQDGITMPAAKSETGFKVAVRNPWETS